MADKTDFTQLQFKTFPVEDGNSHKICGYVVRTEVGEETPENQHLAERFCRKMNDAFSRSNAFDQLKTVPQERLEFTTRYSRSQGTRIIEFSKQFIAPNTSNPTIQQLDLEDIKARKMVETLDSYLSFARAFSQDITAEFAKLATDKATANAPQKASWRNNLGFGR